jgi:Lar family restriction alleviation protein
MNLPPLKTCPFCGSMNLRYMISHWKWVINCLGCNIDGPSSRGMEDQEKAAERWNLRSAPMTESKAASNGVAVNESQTELRLVDDTQKETSQSYYEKKLARVAKHAEKYITTDRQLAEFRELIAEETRKETE